MRVANIYMPHRIMPFPIIPHRHALRAFLQPVSMTALAIPPWLLAIEDVRFAATHATRKSSICSARKAQDPARCADGAELGRSGTKITGGSVGREVSRPTNTETYILVFGDGSFPHFSSFCVYYILWFSLEACSYL